jgi:hypothetical protein
MGPNGAGRSAERDITFGARAAFKRLFFLALDGTAGRVQRDGYGERWWEAWSGLFALA